MDLPNCLLWTWLRSPIRWLTRRSDGKRWLIVEEWGTAQGTAWYLCEDPDSAVRWQGTPGEVKEVDESC